MSAEALKAFTEDRIRRRVAEYASDLVSRSNATLDDMRLVQGVIRGLNEAMDEQTEAYRNLGA